MLWSSKVIRGTNTGLFNEDCTRGRSGRESCYRSKAGHTFFAFWTIPQECVRWAVSQNVVFLTIEPLTHGLLDNMANVGLSVTVHLLEWNENLVLRLIDPTHRHTLWVGDPSNILPSVVAKVRNGTILPAFCTYDRSPLYTPRSGI